MINSAMFTIKWLPLDHCPEGQLKRNNPTDAGYDLMCAKDIYVPTIKELDAKGLFTWEDIGYISDIDNSVLDQIDFSDSFFNYSKGEDDKTVLQRKKYKFPLVSTGVCVKASDLMWFGIFSRSGVSTKYNMRLANGVAVIDYGYSTKDDELFIAMHADHSPMIFTAGTRIAQLVPMAQLITQLERVEDPSEFEGNARGGFSSSGLF